MSMSSSDSDSGSDVEVEEDIEPVYMDYLDRDQYEQDHETGIVWNYVSYFKQHLYCNILST